MGADPIGTFRPVAAPRAPREELPTTVAPRIQPALQRRRLWERRYARLLGFTDATIVLGRGRSHGRLTLVLHVRPSRRRLGIARVAALTAPVWLLMLVIFHTRGRRPVGLRFHRVQARRARDRLRLRHPRHALHRLPVAGRPHAADRRAARSGSSALLVGRWSWRRWLIRQRAFGPLRLARARRRQPRRRRVRHPHPRARRRTSATSWSGAATTEPTPEETDRRRPRPTRSSARWTRVAVHARELGADSIIVASRPDDDPDFIKRLSWELEGTAAELILSSRLTDVAGPRISLRQVDGLPLIHVKIPDFEGGAHMLKRAMDIVRRGRRADPDRPARAGHRARSSSSTIAGPVFFRRTASAATVASSAMLKFRTMRTTAETRARRRCARRTRAPDRSSSSRRTPASRGSARCCAGSRSTSCPSSGTCCAAT